MLTIHMLTVSVFLAVFLTPFGATPIYYSPTTDEGFTATNSPRLNNRPLYGNGTSLVVLAGDRPLPRFADNAHVYGVFLVGVVPSNSGSGFWAHNATNVISTYRAGKMHWAVSDDRVPGVALSIAAVPSAVGVGMVIDVNVSTTAAASQDLELVWGFGCGIPSSGSVHKVYDPMRPANSGGHSGSLVPFWSFIPSECSGNLIKVDAAQGKWSIDSAAGTVTGRIDTYSLGINESIYGTDAHNWTDFFTPPPLASKRPTPPVSKPSFVDADTLFVEATLWLDAGTIRGVPDGAKLATPWMSGARMGGSVSQSKAAEQPIYRSKVLNGQPAVAFDGKATWLEGALLDKNLTTTSTKTIVVVFEKTKKWVADKCCSGVVTLWTKGNVPVGDQGETTNGIAVKTAGGDTTVMVLDYAGESNAGHENVDGVATIASAVFSPTTAAMNVSKCPEIQSIGGGRAKPADTIALGRRASDVTPRAGPRYFSGVIAEVLVWTRVLSDAERSSVLAALGTKYNPPRWNASCSSTTATPIVGGRVALTQTKPQRLTWTLWTRARLPRCHQLARRSRKQRRVSTCSPPALW
jgi:hypothetical protein